MTHVSAKSLARTEDGVSKKRWVAFAVACLIVQALVWTVSEPPELFSDFYKAYFPAGELILTDGLTAAWPFREEEAAVNFVNIPILAWMFAPFAALDEPVAGYVFLAAGFAAVVGTLKIFKHSLPNQNAIYVLLALFIINGPLVNSLKEGNTTHFVLLLIVGGIYFLNKKARFIAGMLFGFCAILKLPLLLLGMYFLIRRDWIVLAGMIAAASATVGLSLLVFGVEVHLDWYRSCVAPFIGKVIPAFNVQSVDGFLMRLTTGAALLQEWIPQPPSLGHKVARYPILLALFALAVIAIWQENKTDNKPAGYSRGFAIVLTLAIISSPLSWSHYYLLLLLPFGLYLGGALSLPDDVTTRMLMTSAMVLTSLPVLNLNLTEGWLAEFVARTVVSLPLFGGLVVFAALIRGALLPASRRHA